MAKNPDDRPATAMEFGRSLQQVAGQAGYAETPVEIVHLTESEVLETIDVPDEDDDDACTWIKRVLTIDPDVSEEQDADDPTSIRVETPRRTLRLTVLPQRDP